MQSMLAAVCSRSAHGMSATSPTCSQIPSAVADRIRNWKAQPLTLEVVPDCQSEHGRACGAEMPVRRSMSILLCIFCMHVIRAFARLAWRSPHEFGMGRAANRKPRSDDVKQDQTATSHARKLARLRILGHPDDASGKHIERSAACALTHKCFRARSSHQCFHRRTGFVLDVSLCRVWLLRSDSALQVRCLACMATPQVHWQKKIHVEQEKQKAATKCNDEASHGAKAPRHHVTLCVTMMLCIPPDPKGTK